MIQLKTGIGFRPPLSSLIYSNRDKIGFVEIIADHYLDAPKWKMKELQLLKEHFVVIPHAIGLSLGSASGIDPEYLQKLAGLIEYIRPPYWSEHISYCKAHELEMGHLSPLVYDDSFLNVMAENIASVKKRTDCPLILENITYHLELPGRTYSDAAFLNTLCRQTDCGLLLDITNLYINSKNMFFDPRAFLAELDHELITQLHFVGYETIPGQTIDTHQAESQPEIFELMEKVLEKKIPAGILLERDGRFHETDEILSDLNRAAAILKKAEIK